MQLLSQMYQVQQEVSNYVCLVVVCVMLHMARYTSSSDIEERTTHQELNWMRFVFLKRVNFVQIQNWGASSQKSNLQFYFSMKFSSRFDLLHFRCCGLKINAILRKRWISFHRSSKKWYLKNYLKKPSKLRRKRTSMQK